MNKIKKIIILMRDLPKTIYFNLKIFDFKVALKLPIRLRYDVKIGEIKKGCIEISKNYEKFMITLGYNGSEFISSNKSYISIKKQGKVIFGGKCNISEGFNLVVDNGILNIGEGTYCNKNLLIQCEKKISIGKNALMGWNINIRDTDGHIVESNNSIVTSQKEVIIGENTWLAADCTILKGSIISDGCIVGCNSLVAGYKALEKNCLIVGIPAKVKKNNILFKK